MTISTVKTEKGNVSCETAEGTVVHININQRSALDCLVDTFRFFRDMKKSGRYSEPSHVSCSASYLGFGVAYISLGLVSVMLANIVAIVQPDLAIFYSGLHFWMGFPFIIIGTLDLVIYKYPKIFWMVLAYISILVNFSVSILAMIYTIEDIHSFNWRPTPEEVCSNLRIERKNYWEPTKAPRYDYGSDYDMERCKTDLQRYKNLEAGLVYMSLLLLIWGLFLAILSVGCRVWLCYRSCTLERAEEEDETLIKPEPSEDISDIIIA